MGGVLKEAATGAEPEFLDGFKASEMQDPSTAFSR